MSTKEVIVRIRRKEPNKPAAHIARELGVSRERVRQLLVELDLPTNTARKPVYCIDCGKRRRNSTKTGYCRKCWIKYQYEQSLITLICDSCGLSFRRQRKYVDFNYHHYFCNHRCQGRWLGLNYGFGARRPC